MTGHERGAAVLLVSSTVLNAVMSIVFIQQFGTGAAIATATMAIGWNVGMVVYNWNRLELLPGTLGVFRKQLPST
jgi:hypothetical protein